MTATTTSNPRTVHTILDSPVGRLTLIARAGILCGLYMEGQRHAPDPPQFGDREPDCLPEVREQLHAYFAGELTEFTTPLDPQGTAFQQRVWSMLRTIPYGQTATYRGIAELIGQPSAYRAVGLANGRNPIGIVIPCHRVLGSAGNLTGYGGGLERKQALLQLEQCDTPHRHPHPEGVISC